MCTAFVEGVEKSSQADTFSARDIMKGNLPAGATFLDVWKHMYVVTREGETLRGGKAMVRILREYPRWRFVATLLSLPIVRWCVELGYDLVAAHRHRIPWSRKKT